MKAIKINKTLLLSILCIVALVGILFVSIYLIQLPRIESAEEIISFDVLSDGMERRISSWQDESGVVYAFLPADTEYVTLRSKEGYTIHSDQMSSDIKYCIDDIRFEAEYSFKIQKKSKEILASDIVFLKSESIPAVFIDTESGSMDYIHSKKGNTEKGSFSIVSPTDSENVSVDLVEFGGRGNTSWTGCDKKGYKIVMSSAQSLFGLSESDTYLLVANARCNYLSNTISFYLSEQMGIKYVPQCRHIDLYLNGEYVGNYILCEKITVSPSSIDITDLEEVNLQLNEGQKVEKLEKYHSNDGMSKGVLWANEPSDVSGGYFLERDVQEYYADEVSGFILSSGDHYVIKGPKHAGQKEVEYISSYMQQTYDAVVSESGYNPTTGIYYADYLDIESFALKYVLEEFLNFNDAGRSSAYYYKDNDGKLYAGPGWDFEGAFKGNSQFITQLNATPYSTDMYKMLLKHQDFCDEVIRVYESLLLPAVDSLLDVQFVKMKDTISESAKMDTVRWNRESFDTSSDEIVTWINERIEFLSDQWLSGKGYVSVTIKSDWQNNVYTYLLPGEKLSEADMPVYTRDGFTFGGWVDKESGELYDFDQTVEADLTLEALWISSGNSLLNSLISKAKQVIPEIVFAFAFFVATVIFIFKFIINIKVRKQ